MEKTCTQCKSTYQTESNRSTYCSEECKHTASFNRKQEKIKQGIEGIDYVIDLWNGYATPRIYGKWMKSMHPGKTTEDYLNEFPDAPLYCENDKNATFKNSGKHMKDPKYRKMGSDAIKGKRNPNHSSRVSAEVRKSRSPFSENFHKYNSVEDRTNFLKSIDWSSRLTSTQLEWWINKGYDEETAKELLKERQATFTLEKCIKKYGKAEGTKIFNERQSKWSNKIEDMYKNGEFDRFCSNFYSEEELKFIKSLVAYMGFSDSEYNSAINGKQFIRYFKNEGKSLSYDFRYKKKIIEFNGDYWHCNPTLYESEYFNKAIQLKAKDKWKLDKWKNLLIENEGYQVLTIWESDWKKSPDKVLNECKIFLEE